MAALGGPTVEASPQLGQNVLIKELSASQARVELQRAAHLPKVHHKFQRHMIDVAFGHLLRLNEDDSLDLEDCNDVDAGLEAAKMQLVEDGFPELTQRLTSLLAALDTCTACSVQGTQAQELTDKPLVTRFTEHDALLRLFLSLKGSSPSIRRRQTTFQNVSETSSSTVNEETNNNNSSLFLTSNQQQALTSTVFAEAPNPDALYDLHGTSVLLPSEVFSNTSRGGSTGAAAAASAAAATQAPENELIQLSQGFDSRPSWAPASVQGLPPLYSQGWLPITPALVEMRGDARKVVPPAPLNVPLSTLAIERTPGAVTGFPSSTTTTATRGSHQGSRSKDSNREKVNLIENSNNYLNLAGGTGIGATKMNSTGVRDTKKLLGNDSLWTLEEAELARDALLSLQGVHSSLLRLRGALAAAQALVHPAAAGILKRIERAASCRHRLQGFIDTFSSLSTANNGSNLGNKNDPVLSALASGLHNVLLSFSQELSSLETSHATEWIHTVQLAATDGGQAIGGKVLQGQGLSLTRVAVVTGKIQTMLRMLCSMFWCNEVTVSIENTEDSTTNTNVTRCEWEIDPGPPRGPTLLSMLCRYAQHAEEPYKNILNYLFARAAQPYLLFLRQWTCSTTDIDLNHPYSVLMSNSVLATQPPDLDDLNFLPSSGTASSFNNNTSTTENNSGTVSNTTINSKRRNTRPVIAIPGSLPDFLSSLEAQILRTGVQLRLLHSIYKDGCRDLVDALIENNNNSTTNIKDVNNITGFNNYNDETLPSEEESLNEIFSKFSMSGLPVFDALGSGLRNAGNSSGGEGGGLNTMPRVAGGVLSQSVEDPLVLFSPSLSLAPSSTSLLLLPHTSSQIDEILTQRRHEEAYKGALVATWCSKLEAERRGIETAERDAALGVVALATEAIARKEAARVEVLIRRQSQKQELLKEQLDAIASVQLSRGGSGVGVNGAEGGSAGSLNGGGLGVDEGETLIQNNNDNSDDNIEIITGMEHSEIESTIEEGSQAVQNQEESTGCVGNGDEKDEKDELIEIKNGDALGTAVVAATPSPSPSSPSSPSTAVVPMSATIEAAFSSTISLQYRLISQACLDFFINHLQLENHLSFLRCTFFLEAGDWADEFLKPLSRRIAALQPLSAHSVHGALQDSLSNSSLGKKETDSLLLAGNLEAEILAGPTAISTFLTCLEKQQQQGTSQRNLEILASGILPRNRASAPLLVSPTALDGLDIVLLRYKTSWPLAALLTEDTALAYAAIFSAMLRVRRVSAALTKVWGPLAPRLADAPKIRPSPKTIQRVQKLRVFVRCASQLTAAVQYFQGLTTSGPTWAALSTALGSRSDSKESNKSSKEAKTSVSDLQELLELHRTYVYTSAIDCLTLCGRELLQNEIDAALRAALTVTSKIETAVDAGRVASGPRSTESSWMHTLSNDAAWNAVETSMKEFENAVKVIRKELTRGVGVSSPLAGLAAALLN